MESGTIDLQSLAGGMDLYATLESGQSYGWRREDGRCYEGDAATGPAARAADDRDEPPWYTRVVDDGNLEVLRVRQQGNPETGTLEWEGSADLEAELRSLLRLDDDLPTILDDATADAADDGLLAPAIEYAPGMRLVRDPPFETLIAFICSTQMRVARIHGMVTALADEFGEEVTFRGRTYRSFPEPATLADATEAELRDLGLGYRAPYVVDTAELVASGELHPGDAAGQPYEEARETLTGFVGVGEKVADCVLLFSLGYLEAVPLDTWIRSAIAEHYPDCDRGGYAETSRAIRERFGGAASEASGSSSDASDGSAASEASGISGERSEADARQADRSDGGSSDASDGGESAGYVQTYVFHYLRTRG